MLAATTLPDVTRMADRSKPLIIGSGVIATIAIVMAIADLAAGFPYGSFSSTMDILFILAGLIVLYLCYDAYSDLR